jgi:hypothetical protein
LVGLGYVKKQGTKLALTETAKSYLLSNSPFYWGPMLKGLQERNEHKRLLVAIKSNANTLKFGDKTFTDMWEEGSITAEAAQNFTDRMHATVFAPAVGAIKSGVFKGVKKLLDMGGGSGCFSIAFVKKYSASKATVLELPAVCKVASGYIKKFKLTKKITTYPANFFQDTWPQEHDGILFSQILHDWPIAYCEKLIQQAYDALPRGGQIFIHEMLLDESKVSPLTVACFNLLMFINHKSQQFTKSQLFNLLRKTGFKNPKVKKTFGYHSVVYAKK